ncbi:MAG: isoaspartyl peptidase/L-asparaginase family protein [Solirubrobacteraceae bacterium]
MTELAGGAGLQRPVIAIHAGAGDHGQELRDHQEECRQALFGALDAGRAALDAGGGATDAVQQAVVVMENFELFNAGRGSTLCADGSVEMSAALMRGTDRAAGAVAVVRHTQNPILAARAVFDSPQVLLVGAAADERAALAGAQQQPNEYFVTDRQRAHLGGREPHPPGTPSGRAGAPHHDDPDRATVGAVCLDADGILAAATSTGGIGGQPPGRVGDCPTFGAGTWADAVAAISCTGDGEAFIRNATAREVAVLTRSGASVSTAATEALEQVGGLQATGGLIAVDASGNVALPFITQVMPRGLWRPGSEPEVWLG